MSWIPVLNQLAYGASQAFHTIVPPAHARTPLTWNNALYPVLCYVPFVFLAYLARRPDTYLIRVLLLPSVVCAILVAAYGFRWTVPEVNVYNWGQALFAGVAIAKSLEYAFTPEGMLKLGESRPGVVKGKSKHVPAESNGHSPHDYPSPDVSPAHPLLPPWLTDALSLILTQRGLSYKFGLGTPIPPPTRPLARDPFLHATLRSFVVHFLLLDLLESLLKLFPGVGTPLGGSMFYPSLSLAARYIVSTTIHLLTGSALLAGFNMVYDLITFLAVYFFSSSPSSWPPVMRDPWHATSMHAFWAKEWHQLLRRTFMVYAVPAQYLFTFFGLIPSLGNLGLLLGTFLASGLFHECAMHAMGRGWDWAPIIFFALQAPILLGERAWQKITGRRVGGKWGRVWVYFVMMVLAQPMVNSWHRRGLGGGMVIPPLLSPVRLIVLPVVQYFLHHA